MTTSQDPTSQDPTAPDPAAMPDPRPSLARLLEGVAELIAKTEADQLSLATPCPEFDVAALVDHLTMVVRRIAVVGRGDHWASVQQEPVGPNYMESFAGAASDALEAWADGAQLGQMYEVPWGTLPGAPILFTWVGELAVHGWDLSTATGQEFAPDDADLFGGWMSFQQIPREGRDETVPFGEVVDVNDDAPLLLKMAGWVGRAVA